MYDPQCHEILLTGKQSTVRGPSFSPFSSKSSPRRDNSLSLGRGLWNKEGETGEKFRVKPSNISVKYTKYSPYDSWKAGASCRGQFLFFLLVRHDNYCPFCSTNAEPDVRVLRWLTRVSSGSVELLTDGKRIGARTFILLFRLPYFSSRTKATQGCVLAT